MATQILYVTQLSDTDALVTQNIIALCYLKCILDVTQCAAYSRIYYSAAILLLSQPLSRFASGIPCHAPTLPRREAVVRQDMCSESPHIRQGSNLQPSLLESDALPIELLT